jgi:hypothetical protein
MTVVHMGSEGAAAEGATGSQRGAGPASGFDRVVGAQVLSASWWPGEELESCLAGLLAAEGRLRQLVNDLEQLLA